MKTRELNLARRPFVNARPVWRLTALLWLLGTGLLVLNGALYWQYFSHTDDNQHELDALRQRVERHDARITQNKATLAKVDLRQLNGQVDFLNRKIAERTFAWSQVFDHLEDVLPDDVRLQSLSPHAEDELGRGDEVVLPGGRVRMGIVGIAKTVEAELKFVDRLFAHPSFERPRLKGDSSVDGGNLRFNLQVTYLPDRRSLKDDEEPIEAERGALPEPATRPADGAETKLAATVAAAPPVPAPSPRGKAPAVASAAPPAPSAVGPQNLASSRPAPAPSLSRGEQDLVPASPDQAARRNRRRSGASNPERDPAAPQVAAGGALAQPRGPAGRQVGGQRGGQPPSQDSPGQGAPLPGSGTGDGGSGGIDPQDPRRPSPRAPSASAAQEIQ